MNEVSGYRIMAIMSPFQGEDAGSTPATRSKNENMSVPVLSDTISSAPPETERAIDTVLENLRKGIFCEKTGILLELPQNEAEKEQFISALDKAFQDPEVLKFLHENTPYTTNNKQRVSTREFVDFFANPDLKCFLYPAYIMSNNERDNPDKKLIGFGSLFGVDDNLSVERGVLIFNPGDWNKGYGKRIGATLMLLAKRSGIKTLTSGTYSNNKASLKNLQRQFKQEGITDKEKGADPAKGCYCKFSINLDDWTEDAILALLV